MCNRRISIVLGLVLALLLGCTQSVRAFAPQPVPPKEIRVLIDDQLLVTDVNPIIVEERTMVPMRAILESLGAELTWNDVDQSIMAQKGDLTIQMWIGRSIAYVNGNPVNLDAPPFIYQGRTVGPVRFISENFGADVKWDEAERRVVIKTISNQLAPAAQSDSPVVPKFVLRYSLNIQPYQITLAEYDAVTFEGCLTCVNTGGVPFPSAAANKEITIFAVDPDNPDDRLSMGTCTTDNTGYYYFKLVPYESGTFSAAYIDASGNQQAASAQCVVTVNKPTLKSPIRVPLPTLK